MSFFVWQTDLFLHTTLFVFGQQIMVWGSSSLRSCASLLDKIERSNNNNNDDDDDGNNIEELIFLSTKIVTKSDWERFIRIIQSQKDCRTLKYLRASGHSMIDKQTAYQLGQVIYESSQYIPWSLVAIGDNQMGSSSSSSSSSNRKINNELDGFISGLLFVNNSSTTTTTTTTDDDDERTKTTKTKTAPLRLAALDLSYKGLSEENLYTILQLTRQCQELKHLDLSRNPGFFQYPQPQPPQPPQPLLLLDTDDDKEETKNNDDDKNNNKNTQHCSTQQPLPTTPPPPMFPFIQHLNMTANDIDGFNAKHLLNDLTMSNSCHVLYLSDNPIGRQPSFDLLRLCPQSIQELHLANCCLDDTSLRCGTTKSLCLESIDLSNNNLSSNSMENLATWFTSSHSLRLRNLNISNNPLTQIGVETLVLHGLLSRYQQDASNRLVTLDLSQTQCGIQGALIAVQSSHVSSLRLFDNQLGNDGFYALASQFVNGQHGTTTTLENLDLAANGASESAVIDLLRSLIPTTTTTANNHHNKTTLHQQDYYSATPPPSLSPPPRPSPPPPPSSSLMLKTIVVGGNEVGEELEKLIQEIHIVHPELDIARDQRRRKQ